VDKDIDLKKSEKESLLKSFLLFFITLTLLNSIIFFFYFQEQKHSLHVEIFNKIKLYNYNFEDKKIVVDIVPIKEKENLFDLKINDSEIFAYFDIPTSKTSTLKIIYPYKIYQENLKSLKERAFLYFFLTTIVLFMMSIFYSIYALKPLKTALNLLDEFLKDIIHDLNTPISSILLNLQILKNKKSDEAIKRIEFSTKNISSLYANLEMLIKDTPLNIEEIDIKNLIDEKVNYYSYIYPHINFKINTEVDHIKTSKNEFSRIVDNLISNACKYNKQDGNVALHVDEKKFVVEDSGIGIKNISRVFDRFYKETDRGIGLGLDIVQKLTHKLGYKIKMTSTLDVGTKIEVTLK